MEPMTIIALVIAVISVISYLLTKKYNKYFRRNHGKRIITHEMAAVIAIPAALWIAFFDPNSFWNWVLFALAAFLFVFTLHGVISRCRQLRASFFETLAAVLIQILSIACVFNLLWLALRIVIGLPMDKD